MELNDVSWTGDASPIDPNGDSWPDLYVTNMQGARRVLQERERQTLRAPHGGTLPKDLLGCHGHQILGLQQ